MTKTTAAQVVLDHLDEIEHKISMGIYQTAIVADLSDAGHEMTLATFRKSLARARSKENNKPTVFHSAKNIDASQYLVMGRFTPDELIQLKLIALKKVGYPDFDIHAERYEEVKSRSKSEYPRN